MIEVVDKFLKEHGLNSPDKTFLVGFSGGCDSLCMLDILNDLAQKYGVKIVALHLNHNWRGDESLNEELNSKRFCEKKGIEFISETLNNDGPKTENAAREARYEFFLRHARNYQNSAIFTAHTRTDNAETIVYRLIKGTGIKGIRGIPPKRFLEEIPIYRPLLQISRKNTEDYCNSKGLVANTDSSNYDISYKRNFIRHKIMPLFDEINFHSEKSITSLAKLATSQTRIVDEYIAKVKKDIYKDNRLLTEKFMQLSDDVKRIILYEACLRENLDYDSKKIENILDFIKANALSKSGSRYSMTQDLWLFANSKNIYLITKIKGTENKNEIKINKEGEYEISGSNQIFSISKFEDTGEIKFPAETDNYAYVNLDETGFDFTIRTRREGDIITPFGMNGSMKLKKYLNSRGISQHEKDCLILLCKDIEVFWVAGVGLSNKLKVGNKPTHVIELKGS